MFKFKGFTLIETLVVISIVALIIPTIFFIVSSIVQQQTKIYRLSLVKSEGDFILNNVSTLIKNNAINIHSDSPPTDLNEECKTANFGPVSTLSFKDQLGNWFKLTTIDSIISSSSAVNTIALNSNKTVIENLTISCTRNSAYSPPIISLSFNIRYNTLSIRPEETAQLYYQSKIKLRNY